MLPGVVHCLMKSVASLAMPSLAVREGSFHFLKISEGSRKGFWDQSMLHFFEVERRRAGWDVGCCLI